MTDIMKKYLVYVEEVLEQVVEVWADDIAEAESQALDWYDRDEAYRTGLDISYTEYCDDGEQEDNVMVIHK